MADFQKTKQLFIYSGNCVRYLSPLADCHICEDVCPRHSIRLTQDEIATSDCNLCGLCVALCPTQVFSLDQFRLMQNKSNAALSLTCAENTSAPTDALKLNCLQQLSPLTISFLVYRHVTVTLYVDDTQCNACAHRWLSSSLELQTKRLGLTEDSFRVVHQTPAEQISEGNQRRHFFSDLWQKTEQVSQKKVVEMADRATIAFSDRNTSHEAHEIIPMRLPLLALYVKHQLPNPPANETELPFRQLLCTDCSFCGACIRICPTEALSFTEQDDALALAYRPELCIDCGICTAGCMDKGLQWGDYLTVSAFQKTPVLLASAKKQTCTHCNHVFYRWPKSEDSLCRFCKK